VFTLFMNNVINFTGNCVLFIDRVDRTRQKTQNPKMISNLNFFYGDENDFQLDEELIKTQNIDKYFKYRFYHWSERDSKNSKFQNFWNTILKNSNF
jgi:hypothetical protein